MPGQRLPMRKIRDVLRLVGRRHVQAQDRGQPWRSARRPPGDCLRRARRGRRRLAAAGRLDDEALEARLYPAADDARPRIGGRSRTGRRSIASCAGRA